MSLSLSLSSVCVTVLRTANWIGNSFHAHSIIVILSHSVCEWVDTRESTAAAAANYLLMMMRPLFLCHMRQWGSQSVSQSPKINWRWWWRLISNAADNCQLLQLNWNSIMTNCLNSPQQNDHHHHQKDDSFFGSLLAGTLYFFPSFSCSHLQDVCF